MFEHLNGSMGHDIHVIVSWWAVLGFIGASFLPPCNGDKRVALKQLFILGPFFWIGAPIVGLFVIMKNKVTS